MLASAPLRLRERALRMRNSTSGLASVQVREVRPGVLPCAAAATRSNDDACESAALAALAAAAARLAIAERICSTIATADHVRVLQPAV